MPFVYRASRARLALLSKPCFTSQKCTCRHFSASYSSFNHTRYTSKLTPIVAPEQSLPVYRVLSEEGELAASGDASCKLAQSKETCLKIYESMTTLKMMDDLLQSSQRQGRISFYMTHYGEEAVAIASAAALRSDDPVFAQYREAGILLYRGFGIARMMNQVFANDLDLGKGRQMPVHYGSAEHCFWTISSPLATQIPQAAGAAYSFKLKGERDRVVACYFGEGAASEGDFHAGLNFASTLKCPVIFFCRNNAYAISTPVSEQYAGDGIAARGPGYGMRTYRVDGNDVLAVFNVVDNARSYVVAHSAPVLIEAMTYRVGHHSTSDDAAAYREKAEVVYWREKHGPIHRFRSFLQRQGWWSDKDQAEFVARIKSEIQKAFYLAEARKKPDIGDMFTDVYSDMPWHLAEQRQELTDLVKKYPDQYPLPLHKS